MENLYGFKEEDLKGLSKVLKENEGKTLTEIFKIYALESGKEKGTIRNLYYAAAKKCGEDKNFCKKYFGGERLKVNKVENFTKEETIDVIKKILLKKEEGKSVRKIVGEMANGDDKLALRYQNKFRSAITDPKIIEELNAQGFSSVKREQTSEKLERLKNEVNNLFERISLGLRKENEELKERLSALTIENIRLTDKLFGERKEG